MRTYADLIRADFEAYSNRPVGAALRSCSECRVA